MDSIGKVLIMSQIGSYRACGATATMMVTPPHFGVRTTCRLFVQ